VTKVKPDREGPRRNPGQLVTRELGTWLTVALNPDILGIGCRAGGCSARASDDRNRLRGSRSLSWRWVARPGTERGGRIEKVAHVLSTN
jgi:hypothetical protein